MATTTAPATAAKTAFRIGVISGSARVVRVGPQIAALVRHIIETDATAADQTRTPPLALTIEDIDVGTLGLPLFDEPGVPAHVAVPDGYVHEHTRAWSRRIAALDAFVFVTPQYNWGVPGALKNALDYLFKEWAGKPYMVVSYGGHGGGHAAAALQLILGGGLRMRAIDGTVNLAFPSRDVLERAARGEDLGLLPVGAADGTGSIWQDRQEDILRAWRQVAALLAAAA